MLSIIGAMYIIVIAWLYITVLMAATEKNLVAGIMTLVFYGLAPVALFLWVFGTPARRRARMAAARSKRPQSDSADEVVSDVVGDVDGGNAKQDQ